MGEYAKIKGTGECIKIGTSPGQVSRAQRAIRLVPDTRAIKREAAAGNHYVIAFLAQRGLVYDGAIHAANDGRDRS